MKKCTLLVDGDIEAHKAAFSSETEVNWYDDVWTLHTNLAIAKENFKSSVRCAMKDTESDTAIICLTSHDNFRYSVLPAYKSNRKSRKPLGYPAFIGWIKENFQTCQKPSLEADDVLGILSTHPTLIEGERIVWSVDKDLKGIPGRLWRGERDASGAAVIQEVTEKEADRWFFTQILTGDATDGYSGCPGVGPVKAAKLLEGVANPWRVIVSAYSAAGLDEASALQQARVARICRYTDYNLEKNEVILWNPRK